MANSVPIEKDKPLAVKNAILPHYDKLLQHFKGMPLQLLFSFAGIKQK